MEFKRLRLSSDEAEKLFGKPAAGIAVKDNAAVIGGFEKGGLAAAALFTRSGCRYGEINFVTVNVNEKFRGRGLEDELYKYCEELFKNEGYKAVICKPVVDSERMQEVDDFCSNNGFILLTYEGRRMLYYMEDLKETVFAEKIFESKGLTKPVIGFNGLTKHQIYDFTEKVKKYDRDFNESQIDLVFARFYVAGEEVLGFVNVKEIVPKVLCVTNYYVDRDSRAKYAMPAMLASTLRVAAGFMPEETILFLQLNDDSMLEGITSIFGEPEEDLMIHEYYKPIV